MQPGGSFGLSRHGGCAFASGQSLHLQSGGQHRAGRGLRGSRRRRALVVFREEPKLGKPSTRRAANNADPGRCSVWNCRSSVMRVILVSCLTALLHACTVPDRNFQPLISNFTASPSQVEYGKTSTLSWTLAGSVTSLTLDGVSVLGESSRLVSPVRRQTYVLVASNIWGEYTRTITVPAAGIDLLAGNLDGRGNLDGTGGGARFGFPQGITVDVFGNVYVADSFNYTIRQIAAVPQGTVITFAGRAGMAGYAEGTTASASFNFGLMGVAAEPVLNGNIYVADSGNHAIRRISADGLVTTLAGQDAGISSPQGVAAEFMANGNVYVTGDNMIRRITRDGG